MLKHLAETTLTRVVNTLFSLITVILATRYLGSVEYGNIGMLILTVSLFQLAAGVAGGPALVYLVPRIALGTLFLGSLLWAVAIHCAGFAILSIEGMLKPWLPAAITGISFMVFLQIFSSTVLLGQKRILEYNLVTLLQSLSMLVTMAVFLFGTSHRTFSIYLFSYATSQVLSAIVGWWMIRKSFSGTFKGNLLTHLATIFRQGGLMQLANGMQILNYRLSFFMIDHFLGRSFVGIYNAGVQLSEGIWIFGKSFALVQYSNISNNRDTDYATKVTLDLLKVTFLITSLCLIILMLLPKQVYMYIFGPEFGNIKTVAIYMAPGILSLALSQILSHFFSGTGKQYYNAWGSAIGLLTTVVLGILLIPHLGLPGAGLTASAAYIAITLFQFWIFFKTTKCKGSDLLITRENIRYFKQQLHSVPVFRKINQILNTKHFK